MTLGEHLGELRRRVVVCVLAFAAAATVAFIVYPHILHFLQEPYCRVAGRRRCQLYVTGPLDGLSLRIKLATYGGLFLGSPVILWELWRFITPGLHRNEKRYAIPFVVASIVLFSVGAVLAFVTFPHALGFLQNIGGPTLKQIYDPNKYLGLIVALMTVFGLTFEFPVILVSLELVGVVSPAKLSSWRRWAIVLIVVFAAVITPSGDPFSMLALAVPLYLFYEVSIALGKLLRR
ncbi:MAG TPA: twin-arginine translocase subunit TatC [Acidimicrobiales bacterium]|nr:twin-arginine translocase subunit TatC [Acidimicrobiales bacterium]HLN40840.1 twin-arginine translocase subunit TatC [Acidimicrobiales bacterium]